MCSIRRFFFWFSGGDLAQMCEMQEGLRISVRLLPDKIDLYGTDWPVTELTFALQRRTLAVLQETEHKLRRLGIQA